MNNPNAVEGRDFEKLLAIERRAAHRSGFWKGLLLGLGSFWLIAAIGIAILVVNKESLMNESANLVMGGIMKDVFESFPDGYWTYNQDKIIPILDRFTNAAADHKISRSNYRKISRAIMYSLKDRRLTYKELENLLDLLNKVAASGTALNKN